MMMALDSKMKIVQNSFTVICNTACRLTGCGASTAPDEQVDSHQSSFDDYLQNRTQSEDKHHRQNRAVPFLGEKPNNYKWLR